jgi:hypothetical protein
MQLYKGFWRFAVCAPAVWKRLWKAVDRMWKTCEKQQQPLVRSAAAGQQCCIRISLFERVEVPIPVDPSRTSCICDARCACAKTLRRRVCGRCPHPAHFDSEKG